MEGTAGLSLGVAVGPVVITGIPRTGTTALHKLLSTDPRFQVLESWLIPAPRVRPARDTWDTDPQFQMAQAQAAQIPPEFKAAHFTAPDEADECLVVLAQSFVSNLFGSTLPIPSYDEWMLDQDMRRTYAAMPTTCDSSARTRRIGPGC